MKVSVKTVYKCDHCKRNMLVKSAAQKHEDLCSKNPCNFMRCLDGCAFLSVTEKSKEVDLSTPFGEDCRTIQYKSFRCTKKEVDMYPHKAVQKGLIDRYPEQFEGKIKMPVACEDFEIDPNVHSSNLPF